MSCLYDNSESNNNAHNKTQHNIESWCQKVLDLLDLTFADFVELHGTFRNCLDFLTTWMVILINDLFFFLTRKENNGQWVKLVDLWNIPDISRNPSQTNSETKRVHPELFNPSQA